MLRLPYLIVAITAALAASVFTQAANTLDIYFVDTEGGQATLLVPAGGESLLIDAGYAGLDTNNPEKEAGRDAERIRQPRVLRSPLTDSGLRATMSMGANTMAWADDDMEIVETMAQDVGVGLPQAALNRELCRTLKPKRFRLDEYGV